MGADKKHKPPFLIKKLKVQSKTTEKLSMTNTDTYCRYLWTSSKTAECSLPGAVEVCSTPLCSARLHSCYTSFFVYTSLNMPSDKHLQFSPRILRSFITFGLVDRAIQYFQSPLNTYVLFTFMTNCIVFAKKKYWSILKPS